METIYADGTPIASYLEGGSSPCEACRSNVTFSGHGAFDPNQAVDTDHTSLGHEPESASFAPPNTILPSIQRNKHQLPPIRTTRSPPHSLQHIHDTWSTAINSRLRRASNAKFLEHFRYILVASQLLNEYLDQGSFPPPDAAEVVSTDGVAAESGLVYAATSPVGVLAVGLTAFALASLLSWTRASGLISKSRAALVLVVYILLAVAGYVYCRRQYLKYLRRRALEAATSLTASWQGYEVSSTSAISFIQEVELVSKGYRLSTPLPPISRAEDAGVRRCARLRKVLQRSYTTLIPACIDALTLLRPYASEEDLDRYYEIYDINPQDIKEATGPDALTTFENDPESLKSLRVLSFRACVLRRVALCHLMSIPADGGKPDAQRWQRATTTMLAIKDIVIAAVDDITRTSREMEALTVPMTPAHKTQHTPTREKMRSQVRKISNLSTGIRTLQAKMQILRDETNRSIEQSDHLNDLGPDLMTQYDSIGADLKELMQAWELGKASLQSNLSKQERRISMASSGLRSPVSSLGGLTAVDEDSLPAGALRALNGEMDGLQVDTKSHRSSMATISSEDEVFEAIAMPKQRNPLSREERISKMYEERERQSALRAKRDANTSMLKELESVISLRPKTTLNGQRVTSM
ncbi:hypothetical protein AMS68_001384 [Peltaster fructicola]|uniref:Vezatin n=1 Tax=Peltaster fructicola TaxID=286661 RepID=A0A6H0XM87_9PEZI|nr:hypothetical protein AMS68_001384 [Peltaster fructicola]